MKDILLVEIGTYELPIYILENINNNLCNYIYYEFNKKYFYFSNIDFFITVRRISFLLYNINFNQNIKIKYNFIYGPELIINKEDILSNKIILNWVKKKKINISLLKYNSINGVKKFFFKKKKKIYNLNNLIHSILINLLFKLIKNSKLMRWGKENYYFFRPIINLVVMYNSNILDVNLFGVKSNNILLCHKFMVKKNIIINDIKNYSYILFKYGKIIVDFNIRKKIILKKINNIILNNKYIFNFKDKNLNKIIWILEWPVVLLGEFNIVYLSLPKEFIYYIIKKHFCFILYNKNNCIINKFLIFINIETYCYNNIIKSYENIINNNLNYINFLFLKDKKSKLISNLYKLKYVVFYKGLGSYLDKIRRLLYICKYLLLNYLFYLNLDIIILNKSILLIKCDLVTNLCKNYPDLKGIIGMYYYELYNKNKLISFIIKNHYIIFKNFNNNINILYSSFISLIDKFDTLLGISILNKFIFIKKGNDPFGFKKLSLCIIEIILNNNFYINLYNLIKYCILFFYKKYYIYKKNILKLFNFILKRFVNKLISLNYLKKDILIIIENNYNNFDLLDIKKRIDIFIYFKNKKIFNKFISVYKRFNNILVKFIDFLDIKKFNILFLNKKQEIILYKYIFLLKKKYKIYLYKHNYKKLFNCFFISIKKIENFLNSLKINTNNLIFKNNRLYLLNNIKLIFNKYMDFSCFF